MKDLNDLVDYMETDYVTGPLCRMRTKQKQHKKETPNHRIKCWTPFNRPLQVRTTRY